MKAYRSGGTRVVAVDGVDLEIGPGEVVGLVGESGSGKASLAHLVVGIADVSAGTITLASLREAVAGADQHQVVAVAVELLGLLGDLFQQGHRDLGGVAVRRELDRSPARSEQDRERVKAALAGGQLPAAVRPRRAAPAAGVGAGDAHAHRRAAFQADQHDLLALAGMHGDGPGNRGGEAAAASTSPRTWRCGPTASSWWRWRWNATAASTCWSTTRSSPGRTPSRCFRPATATGTR